jgi:hypothetical protein
MPLPERLDDRWHYESMLQGIELFRRGKLHLQDLVHCLGGPVTVLELPAGWREEFYKHWGTLEEINAYGYEEGHDKALAEYSDVVEGALVEIERLVRKKRELLPGNGDESG